MRKKPLPDDVEKIMKAITRSAMEMGEKSYADDTAYFCDCLMYALPSAMINFMAVAVKNGWFDEQLVRRDLVEMEKVLVKSFDNALSDKGGIIWISK